MRFLIITILSCFLLTQSSCKSIKKPTEEKVLLKVDSLENGFKKLYLLKNKKIEISSLNGALTYKISDNSSTNVLLFDYAINQDQLAYDGGYREEIVFEVPNNGIENNYLNEELENTKMLFGRYCNCRGKNGLYKIREGKLHIISSKKETHFNLKFKINEVPQVTEKIDY